MNNSIIFFLGVFFLAVFSEPGATQTLKSIGKYNDGMVKIKWVSDDLSILIKGFENGYKIERRKLFSSDYEVLNNGENVFPYTLKQFEALFQEDSSVAIMAELIHNKSTQLSLGNGLSDADKVSNKLMLIHYLSEIRSENAKQFGFLFTDLKVPKEKFLYRITLEDSVYNSDSMKVWQPIDSTFAFINPFDTVRYHEPLGFEAHFKEHEVELFWDVYYSQGLYSTYVLERAEGPSCVNFKSVTGRSPILPVNAPKDPLTKYRYLDSLPDKTKEYCYRVKGLDPFGDSGKYSKVIKGKSRRKMDKFKPTISGVIPVLGGAKISFSFPDSLHRYFKGFMVFRSPSQGGGAVALSDTLSVETQSFVDNQPLPSNYYTIRAFQKAYNAANTSSYFFYQLADSIPPSPTIFTGGTAADGKINLSWKKNTEPDFYGYKLLEGFDSTNLFPDYQRFITDSFFIDTYDTELLNRYKYFKIISCDLRFNCSEPSEMRAVKLPDFFPPTPPVVHFQKRDSLVVFNISIPDIEDIKTLTLRKELKAEDAVEKHIEVKPNTDIIMYDTLRKTGTVTYSFMLFDEDGNNSESRKILYHAHPVSKAPNRRITRLFLKYNSNTGSVILNWDYTSGKTPVAKFLIYRKIEGSNWLLHDTISAGETQYNDIHVKRGSYTYALKAVFEDGEKTPMGMEKAIQIQK